ncbi:hypothetical protein G6F22_019651 [Rhizopus arrhizus]|nr:hypothetical protein G6F22_019651 [Rhizopus arrhizus]
MSKSWKSFLGAVGAVGAVAVMAAGGAQAADAPDADRQPHGGCADAGRGQFGRVQLAMGGRGRMGGQ